MIRAVDKATGEVLEFDYQSEEDLANQYFELGRQIAALEDAKDQMRTELMAILGDEDKLTAGRFLIKRERRVFKEYDLTSLKAYLDPDQLDIIMVADKKKTRALLDDLIESEVLTKEDRRDIEDNMQIARGYEAIRIEPLSRIK